MSAIITIILALIGLAAGGTAYTASTEVGADGATTTDWGKFAGKFGSESLSMIGTAGGAVAKYWTGMSTTDKVVTIGALTAVNDGLNGDPIGTTIGKTASSIFSSTWFWIGVALIGGYLLLSGSSSSESHA